MNWNNRSHWTFRGWQMEVQEWALCCALCSAHSSASRVQWMEQMPDVQMCNYPSSVELLLVPVSYSSSAFVACCLALRASHLNPALICALCTKLPLALQCSRHPWQGLPLPTLHLWNSPGSQAGSYRENLAVKNTWKPGILHIWYYAILARTHLPCHWLRSN